MLFDPAFLVKKITAFRSNVFDRRRRAGGTSGAEDSSGDGDGFINAPVERDYHVCERVLGKGYSGHVVLGRHRKTGDTCALKMIKKQHLSHKHRKHPCQEARIHLSVDHPNVAKLLQVYETDETFTLVIEHCKGGELFHRLNKRRRFKEDDVRQITRQMLLALAELHSHGIVHRDVKMANWLFGTTIGTDSVKLIDFGFACRWNGYDPLSQTCGTASYMAPEVFSKSYTDKCDIWSLGVIVHTLLTGKHPFRRESHSATRRAVENCDLASLLADPSWAVASAEAKEFLRNVLTSHDVRMSAAECLDHPWIRGHVLRDEHARVPSPKEDLVVLVSSL